MKQLTTDDIVSWVKSLPTWDTTPTFVVASVAEYLLMADVYGDIPDTPPPSAVSCLWYLGHPKPNVEWLNKKGEVVK